MLIALACVGLALRFWRDRERAAASLATLISETELARDLLDLTSDAVVVVEADLRVIRANKVYLNKVYLLLREVSFADLDGAPLASGQDKHPELDEYLQSMLLQMQKDRPDATPAVQVGAFVLETPGELAKTFEVRAVPYRTAAGVRRGTVIALTDVTDRVAAEARVDQAAAAMDNITSALSLTFLQMRGEANGHVWAPCVKGLGNPYW